MSPRYRSWNRKTKPPSGPANTARSPRAMAAPRSSRIAVDLPVPVVPRSLKCLVSSAAATETPARVNCSTPALRRRALRRCSIRPSARTTPRLCVSVGLRRISLDPASPSAQAAAAKNPFPLSAHANVVGQCMGSVPRHDVEVGIFAIDRRLAIHADAEPCRLATAAPLYAAAAPFEHRDAGGQFVVPRLQRGDLRLRRQCPAHDRGRNAGAENGDRNAPEPHAHGGAASDLSQRLCRPLGFCGQSPQFLDQRAPDLVAYHAVEVAGMRTQLLEVGLRELLMSLRALHEETELHGRIVHGRGMITHARSPHDLCSNAPRYSDHRPAEPRAIPPPPRRLSGAAAMPAWHPAAPAATAGPMRISGSPRDREAVRFAREEPPAPRCGAHYG